MCLPFTQTDRVIAQGAAASQPTALHGGLYGAPGMYRAHSALVMGSPTIEQIYDAAEPGFASHRRVVLSWLPAAMAFPVGLKATEKTVPDGPLSVPRLRGSAGLVMSHSDTVLSPFAVARLCPSGLNTTS